MGKLNVALLSPHFWLVSVFFSLVFISAGVSCSPSDDLFVVGKCVG